MEDDIKAENLVTMQVWYEYKVVMTTRSVDATQAELNQLAGEGWRLVSATDNLMYLEKRHYKTTKGGELLTEG